MDSFILVGQTLWFLIINHFVGWVLTPKSLNFKSRLVTWSTWNALGSAALVLGGMILIQLDFPGRYIVFLPIVLLPVALLLPRFRFNIFVRQKYNSAFPEKLNGESTQASLSGDVTKYGTVILLPLFFLYFPFFAKATSGLYSISGGDHSIYLRVAEFFLDHGINGYIPDREVLLPPYPNWNILTYIKSIQSLNGGLFGGSVTSMPYMALWPGYIETSYMASLCLSFIALCTSSGALIGYLFKNRGSFVFVAMVAASFSNLFLWSAARHSTPAFFSLGIICSLILVVLTCFRGGSLAVLPTSILAAAVFAAYSPCLLVFSLIAFFYLLALLVSVEWSPEVTGHLSRFFSSLLYALLLFLILLWPQKDTMLDVLITATNFKGGADFGLHGRDAFFTISSSVDFDLLFPTSLASLRPIVDLWGSLCSVFIYLLVFASFILGSKTYRLTLIPFVLILSYLGVKNLSLPDGQYSGIRLIEMLSAVILPMAAVALYQLYLMIFQNSAQRQKYGQAILVAVPLLLLPGKISFWNRILMNVHHEQSDFITSDALRMAGELLESSKNLEKKPLIYWFGNGPVAFANAEILFRHLPYFEAYNYDYESYIPTHSWWRHIHLDILAPERLSGAIFAIPKSWRQEVITDNCGLIGKPNQVYGNISVYDTNKSSGITFIGDAWNSPIPYSPTDPWGRYLLGRKGGIAIWSPEARKLSLSFKVFADKKNSGQGVQLLFGSQILEKEVPDQVEFSFDITTKPGMNIILVSPTGVSKSETWGLIERKRFDQLTFTNLTVNCPIK